MKETVKEGAGHRARWPVFWTILLLLGCAGICWLIWEQYETLSSEALAQEKEKDALLQKEAFLKNLIAEEPCKALEKFRASTKDHNKK